MLSEAPEGVTTLLGSMQSQDEQRMARLIAAVYPELRERARRLLAKERPGHTFQATDLVHEAYMELFGQPITCKSSGEFFALATTKLSRLLIDHARHKLTARHGGDLKRCVADWDSIPISEKQNLLDIVLIGELLSRLHRTKPRQARAIEMHYFLGLKQTEIADILNVSLATVEADLKNARERLRNWASRKRTTR